MTSDATSKTPRTDAKMITLRLGGEDFTYADYGESCQLERELQAANERLRDPRTVTLPENWYHYPAYVVTVDGHGSLMLPIFQVAFDGSVTQDLARQLQAANERVEAEHQAGLLLARDLVRDLRAANERAARMETFAKDMAEGDCEYGTGCPAGGTLRHGECLPCRARRALSQQGAEEGGAG